jgi:hypothetical protein
MCISVILHETQDASIDDISIHDMNVSARAFFRRCETSEVSPRGKLRMTFQEHCFSSAAIICVSITQTRPPRLKVFETCFQRGSRVPQAFALYLQSDFVHAPPPHPDRIDWTTRAPAPGSASHFPVDTRDSASRTGSMQCAEPRRKSVESEQGKT